MIFPPPKPLLTAIVALNEAPIARALCPNFEFGHWRFAQLASHIFDWLPEVALRPNEREALQSEPFKQLARASRRLFDTDDPSARGEIGEILLHAACRQEFGTIPFVARLFHKMRTNDSVTSVDVVHLLADPDGDDLQLWLGEAKLYQSLGDAKSRAIKSIAPLWSEEFLGEMKALIGPKVDAEVSYAAKLNKLFSEEESLDTIVDRLVIPICIAADYPATAAATTRTAAYLETVAKELVELRSYLRARVPTNVTIACIFLPMDNKRKLESAVNAKLKVFL